MTFQEFIANFNGQKKVGNTPENKGECVGLVMQWFVQTLGKPQIWGNAKDLYDNADPNFYELIPNTPEAVPQAGDAIVWNGGFMGSAVGHTALATGTGDTTKFEVFEQNMPLGNGCRLHTYPNYNYVKGWIRVKGQNIQEIIDELRMQRDNNHNKYQEEVSKNNELTKQLQDEQQKNQDLREIMDKQTKADADLGVQLLDAQHKNSEYDKTLQNIATTLNTTADEKSILGAIESLKTPIEEQVKPLEKHALILQEAIGGLLYQRVPKKDWTKTLEKIIGFLPLLLANLIDYVERRFK